MIVYPKKERDFSIFVNNEKRVKEVLGVEVKHTEDLMEKMQMEQVKEFYTKQEARLHSFNQKDMLEFYQETGLYLLHVIEVDRYGLKMLVDIHGAVTVGDYSNCLPGIAMMAINNLKVFQHHLLVVTKVNQLIQEKEKIYAVQGENKKCIDSSEEEKQYLFPWNRFVHTFNELVCAGNNLEKRIQVVQNAFGENVLEFVKKEEIVQIELSPKIGQLYLLLKNGDLYEWNRLYAKNVKHIWAMNNDWYYLIYTDDTLEPLTFTDAIAEPIKKYKKIIYRPGFIESLLKIDNENDVELIEAKDYSSEINITKQEPKEEVLSQASTRCPQLEQNEKMPQHIYVSNPWKVGNVFGTTVKQDEDILLCKDKKVQEFIQKYRKYLSSCKLEDMQEFFHLTGLFLTFVYRNRDKDSSVQEVIVNCNGAYVPKQAEMTEYVFNQHLAVYIEVKDIQIMDHKIVVDGKEIAINLNYYTKNLEEKIEFEKKKYTKESLPSKGYLNQKHYQVPDQKITYMTLDLFHQVISLTEDGEVYINQKLYAQNVKHIIEWNQKDIYFIHKDNVIEQYSASQISNIQAQKYDKVFYGDYYLVTLKDTFVRLYFSPFLATCDLLEGETFEILFDEVEDIAMEYSEETDQLVLIKNGAKIKMPILGILKKS